MSNAVVASWHRRPAILLWQTNFNAVRRLLREDRPAGALIEVAAEVMLELGDPARALSLVRRTALSPDPLSRYDLGTKFWEALAPAHRGREVELVRQRLEWRRGR